MRFSSITVAVVSAAAVASAHYSDNIYARDAYDQDLYARNVYDQDIYVRDVYDQDLYARDVYDQDIYARDTYYNRRYYSGSGRAPPAASSAGNRGPRPAADDLIVSDAGPKLGPKAKAEITRIPKRLVPLEKAVSLDFG